MCPRVQVYCHRVRNLSGISLYLVRAVTMPSVDLYVRYEQDIFFSFQTDLCGIKWRKLVCGDYNFSSEPLDDPVLASFSRCLAGDILCVWRRVATQQPASATGPHSANQGAGGLFDPIGLPPGLGGPGPAASNQNQHPPLSLHAAKELWIFWYGEEPDLSGLVSPELIAAGEFQFIS